MGNTLQSEITQQDIDKWVKQAYDTACKHGFHDKEYSDAHCLMLMITEISEAVEADRKNKYADKENVDGLYSRFKSGTLRDDNFKILFERFVKDSNTDELADVCIRIFDFCGLRNIKAGFVSDKAIEDSNAYLLISGLTFTEFCFRLTGSINRADYDNSYKILRSALTGIAIYCDIHGIDLKKHIELKMKYNEIRPFKNGKNY